MNQSPELVDIRDAFFGTVHEIARRDPNVVFLTADMGAWSLTNFREELPEQFFNVGISEQNMVSVAAGLALEGKRPFVYAIIPFLALRCLEQIKVDICAMHLPVTLVGGGPGLTYASDGLTHHAIEDVAIMRTLPGMSILNPCDQFAAEAAAYAGAATEGPLYVRVGKGKYPAVYSDVTTFHNAMCLIRRGTHILFIATGAMTHLAFELTETLADRGIDAGILDVNRLKPLDDSLLREAIGQHRAVVTLEEHTIFGGLGSAVSEVLARNGTHPPLRLVGIRDRYCERYGDLQWTRTHCDLDMHHVATEIDRWLRREVLRGPATTFHAERRP